MHLLSPLLFPTACTEVPSLSLSLFIGISQFNHSALRCQLCLDWTIHTPQEYTFTYFLNKHIVQITKKQDTKALYYLSNKKNMYGSWECRVEQYPSLHAVYYIGPQTSAPPAAEDSASKCWDIMKEMTASVSPPAG